MSTSDLALAEGSSTWAVVPVWAPPPRPPAVQEYASRLAAMTLTEYVAWLDVAEFAARFSLEGQCVRRFDPEQEMDWALIVLSAERGGDILQNWSVTTTLQLSGEDADRALSGIGEQT